MNNRDSCSPHSSSRSTVRRHWWRPAWSGARIMWNVKSLGLGYWSNHVWLIYHLMNSPAFMNKTTKRWLIVTYDLSATRITGERVKSDGEQENNCSQARVDSQEPVIVACSVGHVHQPPQCHYKQHLCHVHALAQCRAREAVCILCKYTYDGSYLRLCSLL